MRDYNDPLHDERRQQRSELLEQNNDVEGGPSLWIDDDLSPSDHQPLEAGENAVERALEQWRESIIEPDSLVCEGPILDKYIQCGIEWDWITDYQNRKFAWCGAFAAWAWRDSVNRTVRRKSFPSTYRLQKWAQGTERVISDISQARRGDLVIVGHKKNWGDHITLFERHDENGFWTVEGNAWGEVPAGGPRREGVIRRWRSNDEVNAIYRPLERDR